MTNGNSFDRKYFSLHTLCLLLSATDNFDRPLHSSRVSNPFDRRSLLVTARLKRSTKYGIDSKTDIQLAVEKKTQG